jgi:hypothetical protein
MNEYLLKVTNVYRVPTVEDALALRESLQQTITNGELQAFSYTTKYVKAKGEIIDEYQVVKATIVFNEEKEPDLYIQATYTDGMTELTF